MAIELAEIKKEETSTLVDGNTPKEGEPQGQATGVQNGKQLAADGKQPAIDGTQSAVDGKKNETELARLEIPLPGTLLEKYTLFKRHYPRKFAKMIEDQRIREEEAFNVYRANPLVDALYDKLERQAGKTENKDKLRKNLPPMLHLKLQYFKNLKQDEDEDSFANKFRDLVDDDDDFVSTFEFQDEESRGFSLFGKSKEDKLRERLRNKQELRITAVGAENLFKWTGGDQVKKSRISCMLHPDCESYGDEMESQYDDPDYMHVTRWNHIFIYRGFSIEMLRGKTIELAVDTRTSDDKLRIGFVKLAIPTSDFGIIDIDQSQHCTDDPELWKNFLNEPEDLMEIHVPLYPTEQAKKNSPHEFVLSTPPKKRKRSKQGKGK